MTRSAVALRRGSTTAISGGTRWDAPGRPVATGRAIPPGAVPRHPAHAGPIAMTSRPAGTFPRSRPTTTTCSTTRSRALSTRLRSARAGAGATGAVVLVDLMLLVLAVTISFATDGAAPQRLELPAPAAMAGSPFLLGLLLASDQVLTDWLTPEEDRRGRAYYLNPLHAFADTGRGVWIAWFTVMAAIWAIGGLAVGGLLGVLGGVLIGAFTVGGCLLLGLVAAWLVVLPIGLLVGVLCGRLRSAQAVRLTLLAMLLLALVTFATPIALTDLVALPDDEGIGLYFEAVLGIGGDIVLPAGVLWTARGSLGIIAVVVPALLIAFRRLPQQEAAGRAMQQAMYE